MILDRSSKMFGILFVISVFLPQFAVMAVGLHLTFEFSKAGLFAFAFLVFNAAALIQILAQPILAVRLANSGKPAKPAYIGCNRILIGASAVTCLLAVRASPETSLTLYMITAALGAVDQIFTGSYPLVAQRSYGVDYARTASLANLMGRGSAAVAPAIAGLGIANASAQMVVLLSLFLLGLPCVNAPYETQSRAAKQEQVHSKGRGIVAYLRALPPWSKWFMVFTIGANLAFSSVAFVILSDARTSQSLAIYTTLYSTFVAVNFLITFGFLNLDNYKSRRVVQILMIILSLFTALYGISTGLFPLVLCAAAIGVFYAVLMISATALATERLAGPRYVEYTATSRSLGRIASLVSSAAAAVALSSGIGEPAVFLIVACLGIVAARFIGPQWGGDIDSKKEQDIQTELLQK